ncbi:MAG: hypothetical protein ACI9LH_001127, partial [Porticoccaceae bacterium]
YENFGQQGLSQRIKMYAIESHRAKLFWN